MASQDPNSPKPPQPATGDETPAEPFVSGAGGAKAHVLIVDDSEMNRHVLAAMCELFDCSFEVARDGLEAIEIFATAPFDLVLMDIQMPRMDGIEATHTIRQASENGRSVPILAVTANVEPSDVRAYLAMGMDGVVAKPIEAGRLLEAILSALKARRGASISGAHREAG